MDPRYVLALASLVLGALLTPAAAQQLSILDGAVTVPGDASFTLANETGAPVRLDSLAMRFDRSEGKQVHVWLLRTLDAGPGSFECVFSDLFGSDEEGCFSLPVGFAPGAVVHVEVGYDPCGICRRGEAPARGRSGGAPDVLLVYSGGSVIPGKVLFDDSNYVGLDDAPGAGEIALGVGPNPTDGAVRVSLTLGAASTRVEVSVHDVLGRRVALLHDGPLAPGAALFGIDTSSWAAGAYVVRASAGGASATARLVVAR